MIITIDNKIGKAFSPTAVFVGYVVLAIGVFGLFGNIFFGLILILGSGFVCFTTSGIQIDAKDRKYKEYSSVFGMKSGQWKPLDIYINLTILTTRQSYSTYSRSNQSITNTDKYYDVFLLNKSHRQKLRVSRHRNKEGALLDAKALADRLSISFVEYSPEISEKTRARRQK